ncbi:MAG: hypothetical protein WDM79_13595 [Terricaulis sp.]
MTAHFISDARPRRKQRVPKDLIVLILAIAAIYASAWGVMALRRLMAPPPRPMEIQLRAAPLPPRTASPEAAPAPAAPRRATRPQPIAADAPVVEFSDVEIEPAADPFDGLPRLNASELEAVSQAR